MKVQEAFDNWIESHKKDFPQGISAMDKIMFKAGYESALSDIEKCEQVNTHDYAYLVEEAIQRSVSNSPQPLRDLGVYLSKLLDEDQWSTAEQYLLKAALTTHQPIEKCAPVYLIVSGADETVVTKEKYDSWTSAKRISYTSQISKEWVGLSDQQIQNLIINSDNYNKFQFIKSVEHTVKQINAPEKG